MRQDRGAQKKTPVAAGAQHQTPSKEFDITMVPVRFQPAYVQRGNEHSRLTRRTTPTIIRGGAR